MNADAILALERPEPALFKLYLIRAILSGPLIFLTLPLLYFRYHTLRYRFDAEGIHMKVGILFRREVNVTYARIQDIHLSSGIIALARAGRRADPDGLWHGGRGIDDRGLSRV